MLESALVGPLESPELSSRLPSRAQQSDKTPVAMAGANDDRCLGAAGDRFVDPVGYARDGDAPTLYHSRDMEDVLRTLPELEGRLGMGTRVVVSEPLGPVRQIWDEVPQASYVRIDDGQVTIKPFRPIPPNGASTLSPAMTGTGGRVGRRPS